MVIFAENNASLLSTLSLEEQNHRQNCISVFKNLPSIYQKLGLHLLGTLKNLFPIESLKSGKRFLAQLKTCRCSNLKHGCSIPVQSRIYILKLMIIFETYRKVFGA